MQADEAQNANRPIAAQIDLSGQISKLREGQLIISEKTRESDPDRDLLIAA